MCDVCILCFFLCDTVVAALERGYTFSPFTHKHLQVSVTALVTWNRETGTERAPPAQNTTKMIKRKTFIMH